MNAEEEIVSHYQIQKDESKKGIKILYMDP
jgi:hypothetical protein